MRYYIRHKNHTLAFAGEADSLRDAMVQAVGRNAHAWREAILDGVHVWCAGIEYRIFIEDGYVKFEVVEWVK
jgi:hypothetical protein